MADGEEMRMKATAPLFARPASPDKQYVLTLADIPEASPGPNAFARQAVRSERHRLESNAFYQQEVHKRQATPPTTLHPALRQMESPLPSPQEPSRSSMLSPSPREPNASRVTLWPTVYDQEGTGKVDLAPLKLVPSDASLAEPTRRGFLEERHEVLQHERSGSADERVPVFVPTPKTSCVEFADPIETPSTRRERRPIVNEPAPGKTPKKSFLGRLKIGGNHRTSASPVPLSPVSQSPTSIKMPVKALAVLGKSPPKAQRQVTPSPSQISIARSPSKRKHFFSRKASSPCLSTATTGVSSWQSTVNENVPVRSSALTKTPPTATSDPSHFSHQEKRMISQSQSDEANKNKGVSLCNVVRSQSLKYFDHSIPPTPPAKNTPPDQKRSKDTVLSKVPSRLPFTGVQSTLSGQTSGLVSSNDRLSPTKFGSYAHREAPTLVTRPSVYSLHASVVPSLTEPTTFEEMKARVDALGLEGFNTPAENVRYSKRAHVYSPSNYSVDWTTRPESTFFKKGPLVEAPAGHAHDTSVHTHGSSSSGGEIPIYYPDLAKDPSVSSFVRTNGNQLSLPTVSETLDGDKLGMRQPKHGHTRSRDHSPNPRRSADTSIFARYEADNRSGPVDDSPTSFSHASAAPSPLQLQPTVYVPPPRFSSKPTPKPMKVSARNSQPAAKTETAGLGIHTHKRSTSASPNRSINIFANAPTFSAEAQASRTQTRTPSPQIDITDTNNPFPFNAPISSDPQKISPMKSKSPASDKLDRMIDMLNSLHARNGEVSAMRDELRATNVRLGQRLAAVESLHGGPSIDTSEASSSSMVDLSNPSPMDGDRRVPTQVAYDFYRSANGAASETGSARDGGEVSTASDEDMTDNETLAELKEANRRLLEMVGGFADKIEALERRVRHAGSG